MKTTHWLSCWQLGLIGLLTSGGIHAFTCQALAQSIPSNIQPDATLGAESSQILPNFQGLRVEVIQGGATRGINLFHSLREFNVSAGRSAYFFSPSADIQNILARVTGANRSEILGTLGTFGNSQPNLFLINPNGIIFGQNARLDVEGSFIGTTANGVQFGNQGNFSATNPQEVPLLTINPSALFVNQINKKGGIINKSQAFAGVNLARQEVTGLRVPDGKSLLLVGGNVNLDGGGLTASSGRVELAGLSAPGNVGLNIAGDTLSLSVPNDLQLANISLTNQGYIDVSGAGKGDIVINARNFEMSNSFLYAGIAVGLGNGNTKAGDINIKADAISLDAAIVYNIVESRAKGNAGNIDIATGSLSVTNGSQIDSSTSGKGNAGNITIQARDAVTFDGRDSYGYPSALFSSVEADAIGNAGVINISAGSLSLTNGAEINSSTSGKGDSGNIFITAHDSIYLDAGAYIYNDVLSREAVGNAGNIDIYTGSLRIKNRAGLSADTSGQGNGGNLTIEAKNLVEILNDGYLASSVQENAIGNAGDITIKTGRLIVRDSQIGPNVFGEGNAGNFTIIATDSVELSGQIRRQNDAVGFPGGLLAQIDIVGKGRGGNLAIETKRLSVSDGSKIQVATFGDGDAGNIFIRTDEIDLFETEKPNFFSTGIFAGVQTDGRVDAGIIDPRNGRRPVGQGGNLTIETRILNIRNGAQVFVDTTGEGDAGKLFIRASESVNVTGVSLGNFGRQRISKITADASERSIGKGGSLTIETPLLNVADGGLITSSSQGKGTAGDINITADVARLNNGKIIAQTASSDGGNINLNLSDYILLRNGSQISTTAGTAQAGGDGGNININSKFIIAIPNENSDITANAFIGAGGNIQINSQGIFGIEARPKLTENSDITASSELGVSGVININAADTSSIQNSFAERFPNAIDANALLGQSCIVRGDKRQENTFFITGSGALNPNRPGGILSNYSTGEVRGVVATSRPWKKGDPIIEATGVYRLSNGQILLSRECSN